MSPRSSPALPYVNRPLMRQKQLSSVTNLLPLFFNYNPDNEDHIQWILCTLR